MFESLKGPGAARALLALVLPLATLGCALSPPRSLGHGEGEPPPTAAQLEHAGDTAYARGDGDRALVEYVKALAEDRGNTEILYKIATVHREMGQMPVAQRAYEEILAKHPRHAGALEGIGLILLGQHLYARAEERLLAAVAADPDRWRALNALGIAADIAGESEPARRYYLEALERQPQAAQVLNNLGYSRYLAGDWAGARGYYQRALDVERDSREAWSNLGLLYVREGRHDEAVAAFGTIMSDAQALNTVGYLCLVAGEYAPARLYLKRAIDASPTYYQEAHQNLARARHLSRRPLAAGGG